MEALPPRFYIKNFLICCRNTNFNNVKFSLRLSYRSQRMLLCNRRWEKHHKEMYFPVYIQRYQVPWLCCWWRVCRKVLVLHQGWQERRARHWFSGTLRTRVLHWSKEQQWVFQIRSNQLFCSVQIKISLDIG